jgi:hypothetical protein
MDHLGRTASNAGASIQDSMRVEKHASPGQPFDRLRASGQQTAGSRQRAAEVRGRRAKDQMLDACYWMLDQAAMGKGLWAIGNRVRLKAESSKPKRS